jgi:DNA-directed RNA polymerase subunit RPC12/RpoP
MCPQRTTRTEPKVCSKCGELKPASEYHEESNRYGLQAWCKQCNLQRNREWRERNREHVRAYAQHKYRQGDPLARRLIAWRSELKRRYGLTPEQYEAMLVAQDYRCAICGTESFTDCNRRALVDHDHETGEIRGLLCNRCNGGLGLMDDSIELLEKAIRYLKGG